MRCIEFDSKYNFEKRNLLSLHSPAGVNYRLKIVLGVIVRTADNFNSSKSCFHIRILRLKNYDFMLGPVYENDSISIWVLSLFHCSFLLYYPDTWNIGYDFCKMWVENRSFCVRFIHWFFFIYRQILTRHQRRFPKVRTGRPDHNRTSRFDNKKCAFFQEFLLKHHLLRAYY